MTSCYRNLQRRLVLFQLGIKNVGRRLGVCASRRLICLHRLNVHVRDTSPFLKCFFNARLMCVIAGSIDLAAPYHSLHQQAHDMGSYSDSL